jgi:hypothetical protein
VERLLGVLVVCDPTDLLALPAVAAAYVYLRRSAQPPPAPAPASPRRPWLDRASVLVAAIASMATSPARRPFVAWQVTAPAVRQAGCARIQVWTAKSGKTGVGVGIGRADATGEWRTCRVLLERASLRVGDRDVATSAVTQPVEAQDIYVPFLFDNEASWNAGERTGMLRLELLAGGERVVLVVPLLHGWHREEHDAPSPPPQPRPRPAPLPLATDDAGAEPAPEEGP